MKLTNSLLGALALVSLPAIAGNASAQSLLTATYTGSVSGTDTDGLFSAAKTNLTGQLFSVVYALNTSTLVAYNDVGSNYVDNLYAGPGTVSVSIGNVTKSYTIKALNIERYQVYSGSAIVSQELRTLAYLPISNFDQYYLSFDITSYAPTTKPLYTSADPRTAIGTMSTSGLSSYGTFNGSANTTLSLKATQFDIAVSAVPEPAAWAMMILGMGAIGVAMRRRVRASEVKFDAKIKRINEGAAA